MTTAPKLVHILSQCVKSSANLVHRTDDDHVVASWNPRENSLPVPEKAGQNLQVFPVSEFNFRDGAT